MLEHVKGGELFGFINDEKEISERRAMRMFRQIVSAVYHCHMINISHRDIKPENIILMDDHATIKVADFGLSALYSQDWELSTSCGSPFYAAPEILKGQRYSGRKVDVYACGVVLYALLARRLPYGEHSTRDLLKVMQTSTFELPRGISSGVEDLVRRMMEQDPRRRITMREVWCHPQFQFYSGNLPLPKGPWNCIDLAPPIIASAYDVDLETIGNLRALHGIEHDTVIHQLSSNK